MDIVLVLVYIIVYYNGKIMFKKKDDIQIKKFYDENNKLIRIICKVPVGNLSKKDAEKRIKEMMDLYKNNNI